MLQRASNKQPTTKLHRSGSTGGKGAGGSRAACTSFCALAAPPEPGFDPCSRASKKDIELAQPRFSICCPPEHCISVCAGLTARFVKFLGVDAACKPII